jgi:tetratricopeptide (TPR) repeat protein
MMKSSLIRINLIFILLVLFIPNLVFAESKTFIKEYTYQASEYDSKVTCRTLALEQVKRLLLEEIGTYLESQTEVKNFQLSKDQITVLTAGVVKVEIYKEEWNGKTYFVKAKISTDSDSVIKSIDRLRSDRNQMKELLEIKKRRDDLLSENERLRKALGPETDKTKNREQKYYSATVDKLTATEWLETGKSLVLGHEWGRPLSDENTKAIEALEKAIELDPDLGWAYYYRALAYRMINDYPKSIEYFTYAIQKDPQIIDAYRQRAEIYSLLDNYEQALIDYNRSIRLDPNNAWSYLKRGDFYRDNDKYNLAMKDYKKAMKLADRDITGNDISDKWFAYGSIGGLYEKLGNYRQAIKMYTKMIGLQIINTESHYRRGLTYYKMDNKKRAINDMIIAARGGHTPAQDFLRSKGLEW